MSTKKVFLGGTCNGSKWRNELIPSLNVDYFDPVVEDWNEEAVNIMLKSMGDEVDSKTKDNLIKSPSNELKSGIPAIHASYADKPR